MKIFTLPRSGRTNYMAIAYWLIGWPGLAFCLFLILSRAARESLHVSTNGAAWGIAISATLLISPIAASVTARSLRLIRVSVDNDAERIRGRLQTGEKEYVDSRLAEFQRELRNLRTNHEPLKTSTTTTESAHLERFLESVSELIAARESEGQTHALAREYGSVGLSQAKTAFGASLIASGLGFLVIVGGAVAAFFTSTSRAAIPVISGALINAVAALFFSQSNQTRTLMHNLLTEEQSTKKFDESLALAREIKDPLLQGRLQALLSINFAEVEMKDKLFELIIRDSLHAQEEYRPKTSQPD